VTAHLDPDTVEVLKHLCRCTEYLSDRAASAEAAGAGDTLEQLQQMIEAVRDCEAEIRGDSTAASVKPHPDNFVCAECGSAEIECLDWVRVNDGLFIGGNDVLSGDDYWCSECESHESPVAAKDYCAAHGHRGMPCMVCGTR